VTVELDKNSLHLYCMWFSFLFYIIPRW